MDRNKWLWVMQWFFGIYFVVVGIMHFIVPEGLPGPMEWMYELSDGMHIFVGIAEIAGGLGLILPGLTGIRPELTAYAAFGLVIVMAGAVVFHAPRGEASSIVQNVVIGALLAYLGYARLRLSPLPAKPGPAT